MNWYRRIKISNNIQFKPHPHFNPDEDEIVHINPQKLDAEWKKTDPYFYIEQSGRGADFKYNNFGKWLNSNRKPVEMPFVSIAPDGSIGFLDGRNRFSYLRDNGIKSIPVVINKKYAPILRKKYSI